MASSDTTSPLRVSDVMAALDDLAPPQLCLENDPHGLLIGDPTAPVARIAVALDATLPVVEAAQRQGAQMVIAHHPLIYHPLRNVRTDTSFPAPVVHACIRAGLAVACAHTNWDVAPGGVNDVLAGLLNLTETRPLQITYRAPLVKFVVFVPVDARDRVLDAMAQAGAGAIGDYDRCAFWAPGTGTFRPLPGANPYIGAVGTPETVSEERLEMILPEARWRTVERAMKAAHPYEEPAYDVYPLKNTAEEHGIGRVGALPEPLPVASFLERVRAALHFPEVRGFGASPDRRIQTVAVCGGAGAFLMRDALAAGADALVTADVRHHEFIDAHARGFLLVDAGHAATESPGAHELARRLSESLAPRGANVAFYDPDGVEIA